MFWYYCHGTYQRAYDYFKLFLALSVLRLVGHSNRQLELALAEQAHVDQVLLVLESDGCRFDLLVGVVHPFGDSLDDFVIEPSEDLVEPFHQAFGDVHHLRYTASADPVVL